MVLLFRSRLAIVDGCGCEEMCDVLYVIKIQVLLLPPLKTDVLPPWRKHGDGNTGDNYLSP